MAGGELKAPGDSFSNEPLINAVHQRLVEFILASYTAFLVYISFVPFDFTRHPSHGSPETVVWGLTITSFPILDVFTNIGLYVPLGALAFAVARRKKLWRITAGIVAVLFASGISFLVEYGQYWVESRVASWVDVSSNALGGLLGAGVVGLSEGQIRHTVSRARWAARRNWWMTLCKVSVCVVLLVHLRPYDVVVDMVHTATSAARRADVSPLAGWHGLRAKVAAQVDQGRLRGMNELPRVQWEYGIDRVADVAGYAGVAALVVLGMAPQFASRPMLYLWAGFVAMSLAGMVTIMRVFLISHGLDTAHFFCGVLGWPCGCMIGCRMLRAHPEAPVAPPEAPVAPPSRRWIHGRDALETDVPKRAPNAPACSGATDSDQRSLIGLPTPWGSIAIGFALATAVVYELVPFDFGTGPSAHAPLASDRLCLVPFLAHFHGRPNDGFYDISGELLRYSIAGIYFALLLGRWSRWPWRKQLWTVVAATGALGLVLESLHLFMAARQTDVTTLIISLVGGFAGAVAVRWASDYRASLSVVVVHDLLTGQLIEGETYKKPSATSRQQSTTNRQSAER